MKTSYKILSSLIIMLLISSVSYGKRADKQGSSEMIIIKGEVINAESNEALVFATIGLKNHNYATVSNSEGDFSLKLPSSVMDDHLTISYIGHETLELAIADINTKRDLKIKLKPIYVNLLELSVFPDNPKILINNVLANISKNYSNEGQLMTAFYRETIKKRRQYTALAEAIVEVNKTSYTNAKKDQLRILKGRKGMNISKMDTLLFKLQGGAHSTLAMDLIKYPYSILSPEIQEDYIYSFQNMTMIDGETHIILSFKQKEEVKEPMFFGKLYIHAETMAISSATFSLNTENKGLASSIFIRKKPLFCNVIPVYANYMVNYRRQGDKWYYTYSRGDVEFDIDWKKRLFNTSYTVSSEMAVTDRVPLSVRKFERSERLKENAVMNETVQGFYDKDFWGEYNVIEPEKSINTAIKKIAKSMEKMD